MADFDVLDVRLHGESIGTLTRLGRDRIVFAFDPSYMDDSARATLSLSFRDPSGHLITDIPPTRTRAHPFFSNLLPEGPLREYLARGAGIDPRREFPLLGALGQDLAGAVTVVPIGTDQGSVTGNRTDGSVLRVRGTPDSTFDSVSRPPPALRFSLAGAQMKLSAAMSATGRLTIPPLGVGGSWIVKLPSSAFPGLPEQEHAMMTLAGLVGIDVPETRLVPVDSIGNLPRGMGGGGGNALAVRRFDRLDDGSRVHVEDFAQILGARPEEKYTKAGYGDIAEVIGREIGDDAVSEFVRRLVFCAMIGNGDAHLKNWAVIYPDRRAPALAPAYDLVSTIAYHDDDWMGLRWVRDPVRFADLSEELLLQLAAKARVPQKPVLKVARDTVERLMEVRGGEKGAMEILAGVAQAIEANLRRVPLAGKVRPYSSFAAPNDRGAPR